MGASESTPDGKLGECGTWSTDATLSRDPSTVNFTVNGIRYKCKLTLLGRIC